MENQGKKVNLDELINGLGIISNVMLLGRLVPDDCKGIPNDKMVNNYKNLCEMTGVYADYLISELSESEKQRSKDNVEKNKIRDIKSNSKTG